MKNNENGRKAMLEVLPHLTPQSASTKASELLRNPDVQEVIAYEEETLKEALITAGVTPKKIAEKVNVLLDAEKIVYKNNMKTGKIEEVGSEPNYDAIDKGLKHATAIHGVKDLGSPPSTNTYNFFINPTLRKKVDDVEAEIKQSLFEALPDDK